MSQQHWTRAPDIKDVVHHLWKSVLFDSKFARWRGTVDSCARFSFRGMLAMRDFCELGETCHVCTVSFVPVPRLVSQDL